MGIFSKEYICPDLDCSNIENGKEGQICPECGTEYKKMTSFQANNLRSLKQLTKKEEKNNKEQKNRREKVNEKVISKNVLFSNDMSDEEIKSKICTEMDNLAKKEANMDWGKLEAVLSSKPELQTTIIGLKVIIDQNKLIIWQNELIYRELKKINEKNS